jgi:hypothetical protein
MWAVAMITPLACSMTARDSMAFSNPSARVACSQ